MCKCNKLIFVCVLILFVGNVLGVPRPECRYPNKQVPNCCEIPIPNVMKIFYQECKSELEQRKHILTRFSQEWCLDECIFEKTGFFENGIFNKSFVIEKILSEFRDGSEWGFLYKTSFDYCSTEALLQENELIKITNLPPFEMGRANCSVVPSFVVKCMAVYMTKACPKRFWNLANKCENYKHFLERCPNQFIPSEFL